MSQLNLHHFNDSKIVSCYSRQIITKAMENEIEKGGEGSRGGKVIGHTKSGKAIYDSASHPEHSSFSKEDHNDAIEENKRRLSNASSKLSKYRKLLSMVGGSGRGLAAFTESPSVMKVRQKVKTLETLKQTREKAIYEHSEKIK